MRYIGSKTKLISEIHSVIDENIKLDKQSVFCDLFSGTGTVADSFQEQYKIIANDSLYACYCVTKAKLLNTSNFFKKLAFDPFEFFNKANTDYYVTGFCYNNFAPSISERQYFSDENAKLIDYIRDTIDEWYSKEIISNNEKDYLIGCLIESVSKVSNVAGVYSAFLHIWDPRATKRMEFIRVESEYTALYDNITYQEDALSLIDKIQGDILYLDPPYTPTQYISQYHVLETIAKNDRPATHGVGAHRDNGNQISDWCKKGLVENRFEQLIKKANFKYIVMSYSDAGLMSKEFIEKVLKRYAKPNSYKIKKINFVKYKNTRAVNREERENLKDKKHFEWLFIIEKTNDTNYVSPLNYIGGKFEVIDFIKQNTPSNIETFYDLFGGGSTVALNIRAKKIVYNDINWIVCDLLNYLKTIKYEVLYKQITANIKKYNLSKGNKEAYNALRTDYNKTKNPILLYLLICYGFEHQIRFNSALEFNNPCGNSGFNDEMLEKLISYNIQSNELQMEFNKVDYKQFIDKIKVNDFVYCDPPYLSTCGAYNDGKRGFNGWDIYQQKELLNFLDCLNCKGIKFMLSNFTEHDNNNNNELLSWAGENNYKILFNNKVTKRNRQDRRELIIINS
jgi:adenine-specific DNA-methyltransferase